MQLLLFVWPQRRAVRPVFQLLRVVILICLPKHLAIPAARENAAVAVQQDAQTRQLVREQVLPLAGVPLAQGEPQVHLA